MGLRKFGRASSALGGFLIFLGIIIIGVCALALFDVINLEVFSSENFRPLFMLVLLVVSVLDIITGIILALR